MATKLQPRTLDIEITEITAEGVNYTLWANDQPEEWVQPRNSTFNTSTLQVGVRYVVRSKVVVLTKRNPKTRKVVRLERYDWVTATPVAPKIKLQARTKKQREAAEALAAMPLVDDGTLISWSAVH